MRTTSFSSNQYKFLTALALVAMVLAALPAMPAYAATITVTNTTDDLTTGNGCSLREAIINANNNGSTYPDCVAGSSADADVITLASGSTHILSLTGVSATTTGDLDISDSAGLTIQASSTTAAIIDGGDIDRVLDAAAGSGNLTLTYITVTNGTTTSGTTGGGISFGSIATLTLTNSTVSNNVATATAACGAGIYSNTAATINITNSTIAGNTCSEVGADGGGLFKGTGGILNITGSTFSGNSANDDGGGMRLDAGTAAITNSTFYNNTAIVNRGGAIQVSGATATIEFSTFSANTANAAGNNGGGAVQISAGSAAINRSILANSAAGKDCDQSLTGSGVITNSLVETNSDCTGSITSALDPGLGVLANYGGPTQTMKITGTSPAYNAASICNSITTDQRGFARPQNGSCDLGAFEVSLPTVVSILRASPNPASSLTVDYTVTFSESVSGVGPSDFTLTVSGVSGANVSGVTGSGAIYTVTVTTGTGAGTIRLVVPVTATINDVDEGNGLSNLPFTTGEVYNKLSSPPGAATLVSPNGSISDTTPDYTWNEAFDTSWYYLWVSKVNGDGSLTTIHTKWYEAVDVCSGGGTCSVTPLGVTLTSGNYRWWIQTYNDAGYGLWSSAMNFSLPAAAAPGAATLVSPNGTIATTTPAYTWNKVNASTWYYLWVSRVNGDGSLTTVHTKWYDSVPSCSGATCSVTPVGVTLTSGNYRWWIQTYNDDGGYGAWSNLRNFTVPVIPAPVAATLVSPNGTIADTTPAYTWNKVNASTWYYLWVSKVNGDGSLTTVHTLWYDSVDVCSGATCSITPAGVTLTSGNYRWWIQTYNDDGGYGAWSTPLNFSLP